MPLPLALPLLLLLVPLWLLLVLLWLLLLPVPRLPLPTLLPLMLRPLLCSWLLPVQELRQEMLLV